VFRFFKKKPATPAFDEIRELLFGDAPLSTWSSSESSFELARAAQASGDNDGAIAALRNVVEAQNLESRHCLQAWHFLRQLGVSPDPALAKQVLGVVLEVHLDAGLDTLAAYADHTARYINHGGRPIVWETAQPKMNSLIDALLSAGQRIADVIGPWAEPRRGPPLKSHIRLNMLTRSGLHFGEGPFTGLAADAMAAPAIDAGTLLMKALVEQVGQTTA
jgi:hypothetical protein